MFHRLLVPIDGSPRGGDAIEAASHLARRTGASIVLLHVQEPGRYLEDAVKVNQDLELQVRQLRADGLDARHFIEYGRPGASIAETAAAQKADLIIMAPHRRGALDGLLHPSVTAGMFAESPAPVLVWPEKAPGRACATFLNIPGALVIVPLDGSDLAERALPVATAFAHEYVTPMLLVRVVTPATFTGSGPETARMEREYQASELHAARAYLAEIRKRLDSESHVGVQSMVLVGDPARELLRLAETHDGSLMVMSTHGRGGITRVLMGSVATRLMRDASLPLLVVSPHIAAETLARWSEAKTPPPEPEAPTDAPTE